MIKYDKQLEFYLIQREPAEWEQFLSYIPKVKELLEVKGFGYSQEYMIERVAYLTTEVSELIDSVKKGLGTKAEIEEVADIIIRLTNIYLLIPKIMPEIINRRGSCTPIRQSMTVAREYAIGENSDKLIISIMMNECCAMISKGSLVSVNFVPTPVVDNMIRLYNLCMEYADLIGENIFEAIDAKMEKNFGRPYKYGTAEEIK